MDTPPSERELSSAIRDADSEDWSLRAIAGRCLAAAADVPYVADILHRLLLDSHDTGVTRATAEALLERWDLCGVRMVVAALAAADDNTGDHLCDAVDNACSPSGEDAARFSALCSALLSDADEAVAREASAMLSRWQR